MDFFSFFRLCLCVIHVYMYVNKDQKGMFYLFCPRARQVTRGLSNPPVSAPVLAPVFTTTTTHNARVGTQSHNWLFIWVLGIQTQVFTLA